MLPTVMKGAIPEIIVQQVQRMRCRYRAAVHSKAIAARGVELRGKQQQPSRLGSVFSLNVFLV